MNPRGEKMHGEVNAVEGLAGDGRFTVRWAAPRRDACGLLRLGLVQVAREGARPHPWSVCTALR